MSIRRRRLLWEIKVNRTSIRVIRKYITRGTSSLIIKVTTCGDCIVYILLLPLVSVWIWIPRSKYKKTKDEFPDSNDCFARKQCLNCLWALKLEIYEKSKFSFPSFLLFFLSLMLEAGFLSLCPFPSSSVYQSPRLRFVGFYNPSLRIGDPNMTNRSAWSSKLNLYYLARSSNPSHL